MIGAERVLIYLYDKKDHELYLKVANFQIREQLSFPANEGLPARPFETGNILIADAINYDDFPEDHKRFKKICISLLKFSYNK